MNTYTFDAKFFATITIDAASQAEAEATIRDLLDCASCNAGEWPNGDPILLDMSLDGDLDLITDGE